MGHTHGWMKIEKSINIEDVGPMAERLSNMGNDLADVRLI